MNKKIIVCFVILIILLAAIIGVPRGENMKQEKIPQEVVEFAKLQEGGKVIFIRDWNNQKVYRVSYREFEVGVWGLPIYILFDGKNVRWANDEERDELMYLNNN